MTATTSVNDRLFDRCRSSSDSASTWPFIAASSSALVGMRQIERSVERIELVKVAMPADWRAWTVIGRLFEVVDTAHGAFGQTTRCGIFGEASGVGGNVVEHPMHPDASRRFRIRRIGIVDDQCEALRCPAARRSKQAAARCPCPRKYRWTASGLRRRRRERSASEPWPRQLLAPTARATPNSRLKTTKIEMERDCFAAICKLLLVRSEPS